MSASVAAERNSVEEVFSIKRNYGELLQSIQPKKIESQQEYLRFISILEYLLEKEEDEELSDQESLLVELLMLIVQEYESETTNLLLAKPLDILIHLMESNNLKQANLVGEIASSGVVSEILNGKRAISKAQARKLGDFFHVSYKLFL
ncbi:MAG: transcriptional regulator [Leptolyngbya sp. SIO4C1]|nr:transcriptional regulator [Leptolyngbya sp. SIO4C1]